MSRPAVTVFVLPEDRAHDAPEIAQRLVRHALKAAGVDVNIAFEAPPASIAAMAIARMWTGHRDDRVRFVQWIARELALGRVVVLHQDADTAWSRQRGCNNRRQFDKLVRQAVHRLHATDNLVEMLPFAAIEAWTYRNTALALELSGGHALHVAAAADPALLEERTDLKTASPLHDGHNLVLVGRRWPAADAWADGRSFRGFADALAAAPALARP